MFSFLFAVVIRSPDVVLGDGQKAQLLGQGFGVESVDEDGLDACVIHSPEGDSSFARGLKSLRGESAGKGDDSPAGT